MDYKKMAEDLYYNKILKETKSIDFTTLKNALKKDKEAAFLKYGNRLGIGQSAYFMVSGTGKIKSISASSIIVNDNTGSSLELATKFIFGNAIRDASNKVKLTDFKTNKEFNALSEALNELIREKVLPSKIAILKVGDSVRFTGALKYARNYPLPDLVVLSNIEKP